MSQEKEFILPSKEIDSVNEFFESSEFYKNAQNYWSKVTPNLDGMLGGLTIISPTDIQGSNRFLDELFKMRPAPENGRALDCGAGIGRVTKNLLSKRFEIVDLVEQDAQFVSKAEEYLKVNNRIDPRVGDIFNEGLQTFTPKNFTYDVIWSQWVLGHLTDADLIAFLRRCIGGLRPNGCIVIKENFTSTDDFCIDNVDSSVTRSLKVMRALVEAAGLRIIKTVKQEDFIKGLFPVYTLACRPTK